MPRFIRLFRSSFWLLPLILLLAPLPLSARDWQDLVTPSPGPSEAIGGTARGCLAGGQPLAADGPGFATVRRWRHRYYGTDELVRFLTRLGADGARAGLPPLLIGDMAQPRGGPLPYGHASHQTGIDADILFTFGPLTPAAREALGEHPPSMLAPGGERVDPSRFGAAQIAYLKRVANDPQTARVFVNFRIKKYLCTTLPAADHGWLHQIRPWLGHDEHFHVRLLCPATSPACDEQEVIPPGDGCDASLEAWFKPSPKPKPGKPALPVVKPPLPAACDRLLKADD